MEQAYRKLIKELENHRLVESIDHNYYEIKIKWKSGIKERLILNKSENKYYTKKYLRSKVYRPWFVPKALWWEDISNGRMPKPNYLFGINDIEHDVSKYPNFINWNWSDIQKSYFFERLILVHEILDFIIKNGWKDYQFPENVLANDLNIIINEDLSSYKMKKINFYRLKRHPKGIRPGEKIIKHFLPYGDYGLDNPSYMFNCTKKSDIKRIYLAIRLIFTRNQRAKQKGSKKRIDVNYQNIMRTMRCKRQSIKPHIIKQIGLYRRLIRDFNFVGKSFYDIDPMFGEKAIAAFSEDCHYYFNKTCPFDIRAPKLSKFLNYDFIEDDNKTRYDFSIYDSEYHHEEVLDEIMKIMPTKVDYLLIYIKNMYYDDFIKKHKPIKYFNMKTSKLNKYCGKWLLFEF